MEETPHGHYDFPPRFHAEVCLPLNKLNASLISIPRGSEPLDADRQ